MDTLKIHKNKNANLLKLGKPQYKKKGKSSDNFTRGGPPPASASDSLGVRSGPPPLVTAWECGADPP